jgi:CheY-like chemotaxis protein
VETILSCGTTLLDTVNHVLDFQKLNFLRDENINRVEAPPSPDGELASSGGEEPSHTPKRTNSRGSDNAESFFDKRSVDTDFSTIVQEVTEGVVLGYEFKDLSKIFGQTDEVKKAALTAPTKVSRIQVVVDIDEFDGGWVFRSNPAAMKRIVGNLVGNAIKYSHESGWIKVTLAAKKITPASNGAPRAKVSFIVSDSGRGMSREFLKTRLFTPFTQENPMAPGAGLGLSIVRQLVDMLDGKIDVKSQLGKGTTFRIELKLTQATPKKTDNLDPLRDSIVSKTSKMKAVMLGFEHFARPETPEQRGESFLYESLTRYVRDWLQMEVVVDPGSSDAAGSQIIILNELSATTKLFELPILKNGPVIVLCNSTPRRSVLDKFESDRDPRLFTFLRKPCGPKKLMRAMQVCLETLENGLPQLLSIKDDLQNPLPFPEMPELLDPAVSRSHIDVADEADFTSLSILPLAAADNSPVSQNQAMIPTANATQQWQQPGPQQKPPFSSDLGSLSRASNPPIKIHTSAEKPGLERRPAAVPMVPTPAPAILDSSPQQPKILCVEDNRINMMLVTTYLKKKNYPFKMAVDGADALEKVKEEATYGGFDCILMDLRRSFNPVVN